MKVSSASATSQKSPTHTSKRISTIRLASQFLAAALVFAISAALLPYRSFEERPILMIACMAIGTISLIKAFGYWVYYIAQAEFASKKSLTRLIYAANTLAIACVGASIWFFADKKTPESIASAGCALLCIWHALTLARFRRTTP